MRSWQIVALIVAGVIVGVLEPGRLGVLFGHAMLYAFLPALIFEAAWNLDLDLVRKAWKPIGLLALPGVAFSAAAVGAAVHFGAKLPWGSALLLGTVLAATDPIAVVAMFRRVAIPRTLRTVVVSEALFNDAVAVAAYRFALAAIAAGLTFGDGFQIVGRAVAAVALGIAIGIAVGYAAAFALRERYGVVAQSAATLVAAYAAYYAADRLGFSGIFASVALGLTLRRLERRHISVSCSQGVERLWEWIAIVANAALFFLAGASVDLLRLFERPVLVVVTIAATIVARAALSYGLLAIRPAMRSGWLAVVRMAGVRGALSLALALAIPSNVPGREAIVDATFSVVVFSVLLSASTVVKKMRRLRLGEA